MLDADTAQALRQAYPRVLAKTLAWTRDLEIAEDVVQDAVERALRTWPERGRPDSVEGWLLTVARNRHVDLQRRRRRHEAHTDVLAALADAQPWSWRAYAPTATAAGWRDDLLRLLFTCCDPVLGPAERTALTLATVVGLSIAEIARAFLVAPRAMEQRLTRARRRLRERRGGYEVPDATAAPDRLESVLAVLHLIFNEGYWSARDDSPIRLELCQLALGLTRSLHALLDDDPEVEGLLALLLLHEARLPARLGPDGTPVALPEQDRSLWTAAEIDEAEALLGRALSRGQPGPYQIEAAIAAVHCSAATAAQTDWVEISLLYGLLEELRPSPVVRVNRAFAVAKASDPQTGLALLDELGPQAALRDYPYVALVRAVLLDELGRRDEARAALEHALELARNPAEAKQIRARLDALVATGGD